MVHILENQRMAFEITKWNSKRMRSLGTSSFGGFPGGSDSKESASNAGDPGLIPGSGRSPGEGNGFPLQYSCLENSMDGGAWQAAVHEITKRQIWLWLTFTFHFHLKRTVVYLAVIVCRSVFWKQKQINVRWVAISNAGEETYKGITEMHNFMSFGVWIPVTKFHDLLTYSQKPSFQSWLWWKPTQNDFPMETVVYFLGKRD